jgi:hypothetical protein
MLSSLAPMLAQDLLEAGWIDGIVATVMSAVTSVDRSIAEHPWIWLAALVFVLLMLLRSKP